MNWTKKIADAEKRLDDALDDAQREMAKTVRSCFPKGTRIAVDIGKARINAVVEGYGCEWSDPQLIRVRNERTGKLRGVSTTYSPHNIEILL